MESQDTWTGAEKKIARRAFDAALDVATAGIMAEFKMKAAAVTTVSEVWALEDYLQTQHRNLEYLFDYRYSQLCVVFGQLIHLGHLDETQLAGLSDEHMAEIRHIAKRIGER